MIKLIKMKVQKDIYLYLINSYLLVIIIYYILEGGGWNTISNIPK